MKLETNMQEHTSTTLTLTLLSGSEIEEDMDHCNRGFFEAEGGLLEMFEYLNQISLAWAL